MEKKTLFFVFILVFGAIALASAQSPKSIKVFSDAEIIKETRINNHYVEVIMVTDTGDTCRVVKNYALHAEKAQKQKAVKKAKAEADLKKAMAEEKELQDTWKKVYEEGKKFDPTAE